VWREKRGRPLLPYFKQDQFADNIQPIILLALLTGLRRSDIFTLEWKHVDTDNQQITKVISKTRRKKPNTTTLDICSEANNILKKWRTTTTNNGLVFPSPVTGGKLNNINKAFKGVLKAAEIEDLRFHDLRHTFASRLVMGDIDLYTVQKLMTHSDPKMTQRYAHLSPDHKRTALDKVFNQGEK
jgi:integrase